jgi:hypothetical protein
VAEQQQYLAFDFNKILYLYPDGKLFAREHFSATKDTHEAFEKTKSLHTVATFSPNSISSQGLVTHLNPKRTIDQKQLTCTK